ncbi:unnamed protein product [Closterium sp. Naga37s-1]|nr:unnamed protein product [Closterium sp. Naga37s-1]
MSNVSACLPSPPPPPRLPCTLSSFPSPLHVTTLPPYPGAAHLRWSDRCMAAWSQAKGSEESKDSSRQQQQQPKCWLQLDADVDCSRESAPNRTAAAALNRKGAAKLRAAGGADMSRGEVAVGEQTGRSEARGSSGERGQREEAGGGGVYSLLSATSVSHPPPTSVSLASLPRSLSPIPTFPSLVFLPSTIASHSCSLSPFPRNPGAHEFLCSLLHCLRFEATTIAGAATSPTNPSHPGPHCGRSQGELRRWLQPSSAASPQHPSLVPPLSSPAPHLFLALRLLPHTFATLLHNLPPTCLSYTTPQLLFSLSPPPLLPSSSAAHLLLLHPCLGHSFASTHSHPRLPRCTGSPPTVQLCIVQPLPSIPCRLYVHTPITLPAHHSGALQHACLLIPLFSMISPTRPPPYPP